jgi:hypothetical protein
MREHGVPLPTPRTAAKASKESSSTTASDIQVRKRALSACRSVLRQALRALVHSRRIATPTTAAHSSAQPGRTSGSAATTTPSTPTAPRASTVPVHIKRAATPAPVTAALEHFTACMREHGITNYPEPEGAGFNMGHVHLDLTSPQFKAAEKACNSILQAIG